MNIRKDALNQRRARRLRDGPICLSEYTYKQNVPHFTCDFQSKAAINQKLRGGLTREKHPQGSTPGRRWESPNFPVPPKGPNIRIQATPLTENRIIYSKRLGVGVPSYPKIMPEHVNANSTRRTRSLSPVVQTASTSAASWSNYPEISTDEDWVQARQYPLPLTMDNSRLWGKKSLAQTS